MPPLNVDSVDTDPAGTVDGRDVATDGSKLDGIQPLAEVNPPRVTFGEAAGGVSEDVKLWAPIDVAKSIEALGGPRSLAIIKDIDLTVAGVVNLYTVPVDSVVLTTGLIVFLQTISGGGVQPRIGVGITAGEDDIFSSTFLTGLTDVNDFFTFVTEGVARMGNAGDVIKLGVDTASGKTDFLVTVVLVGKGVEL